MTRTGVGRIGLFVAFAVMVAGCSDGITREVGQAPAREEGKTPSPAPPGDDARTSSPSPSATESPTAAPVPPGWAPPDMSSDDVERAVAVIETALRQRGLDPVTDLEGGTIEVEGKTLGLVNVVAAMAAEPPERWGAVVNRHLDVALGAAQSDAPDSFTAVAGDLRVLLYPRAYLRQAGGGVLRRAAAPGLFAVPVRDDGEAVQLTTSAQARDWGVSTEEVFTRAAQNTFGGRAPRPVRQGGFGLVGPGFYSTSWLLSLGDILGRPAPDGALVVVPRRAELVFTVVGPSTDERVVQALAEGAAASYAEGPNAVSDDVYWWRDGTIVTLRTSQRGGRVRISVPAALARILND